jgi:hypothetical protein
MTGEARQARRGCAMSVRLFFFPFFVVACLLAGVVGEGEARCGSKVFAPDDLSSERGGRRTKCSLVSFRGIPQ